MNGEAHGWFNGGRRLRQGDPSSPLIFVLVMEYLSRLYVRASKEKGFKFHPYYRKSKMVHLMFVDDLIVFSAAEPVTVKHLMKAFEKFSKSTRLEANKHKSQIVMGDARKNKNKGSCKLQGSKKEPCHSST